MSARVAGIFAVPYTVNTSPRESIVHSFVRLVIPLCALACGSTCSFFTPAVPARAGSASPPATSTATATGIKLSGGPPPPPPPPGPHMSATATTVPTATPTPTLPPVLAVQLQTTGMPGTLQVIHVRTLPGTLVHVRVAFPNGDRLTANRTADAHGRADAAYIQRPSEITRHQFSVGIIVSARFGPTVRTVTRAYRLGFAAIDLSIEPRFTASRTVTFWTHTWSLTHVTLRVLSQSSSSLLQLGSTTGRDGWCEIRLPITGILRHHRTDLRALASAKHGGDLVSAESLFSVR